MLPDLPLLLNMDGQSLASLTTGTRMESLLKSAKAIMDDPIVRAGGWEHTPGVDKKVRRLVSVLSGHGVFECVQDFAIDQRAALAGDPSARARLDALGYWELASRAFVNDDWLKASAVHCAELERASQTAYERLRQSDFVGAAHEIQSNPLLSTHFTATGLYVLRRVQLPEQALIIRAAGLCEFLLAQAARLSWVTIDFLDDASLLDAFQELLDRGESGCVNPGRAFFRFFLREAGAQSIGSLLSSAAPHIAEADLAMPNESTLKRWSCGKVFPSERALLALLRPLARNWDDKELKSQRSRRIGAVYFVARRIENLSRLAQSLLIQPGGPHKEPALLLLLECATVDEWIASGYWKWLTHWRESTTRRTAQTA